ncbi:hypothetical protein AOQ84DRAFT_318011 [Glonium stellatum]|uniref:Decapping nuclease n=1 Tax=Glonium stellatum TaxID=574774 RepID=A0A8E2F2D0_9PEZI|nr:hypothetical protein AOQ84DRAFT_318011 [Glonium stellatum]
MRRGTSKQIATIVSADIGLSSSLVRSNSGFEELCTYNWGSGFFIYVPGAPPKWTPPQLPHSLPKDSGMYHIDENGSKAPDFPFLPLFKSLRVMRPLFNFASVDLLANRNSLRKLTNFAMGKVNQSFRIDLYVVQTTLVMVRHERNTIELVPGSKDSGYGHNFEDAFTTPEPGLEGNRGHHRVVQYLLGDLRCVVQFEVDAWYEAGAGDSGADASTAPAASGVDSLLPSLGQLSVTEPSTGKRPQRAGSDLAVVQCGRTVPSCKLAEVKTNGQNIARVMQQVWFGRTPYLLGGVRRKEGVFTGVELTDVGSRFPKWEAENQKSLRKLSRLIAELKAVAMKSKTGACVVTCDKAVKPARLDIFEPSFKAKTRTVPEEFVREFWRA